MLKRYFIAGLLVWVPIVITIAVIRFLVNLLDNTVALLPHQYQPEQWLGTHIPGIGVAFSLIVLFLTGLFVTNIIGHRIVALWDKTVSRIPLIRSIHSAVKQVMHALLQPQGKSFRKVLLIEFPRKGTWSVAFQTSDNFTGLPGESEAVTAFVPTTPNPTSGFLMVIPRSDVTELDISVEEALRMIISLGVVTPEQFKAHTEVVT